MNQAVNQGLFEVTWNCQFNKNKSKNKSILGILGISNLSVCLFVSNKRQNG